MIMISLTRLIFAKTYFRECLSFYANYMKSFVEKIIKIQSLTIFRFFLRMVWCQFFLEIREN